MGKKTFIHLVILSFLIFINLKDAKASIFLSKESLLNSSDYISNYLKGTLSEKNNNYFQSKYYFAKTKKLSSEHLEYSRQYVSSLVLNEKISDAFNYIQSLDQAAQENYLFNLVQSIFLIKNGNYLQAKKILRYPEDNKNLNDELLSYIHLWLDTSFSKKQESILKIEQFKSNFQNIKLIQSMLIYDYLDFKDLYKQKANLVLNQQQLGRYHYFHVVHLLKNNNFITAKKIIKKQLDYNASNLLIKQSFIELENKNINFFINSFDSRNIDNGLSELFYLFANLMQQQENLELSKLYFSISHYLNPDFSSNYVLKFENYLIENNSDALELATKISSIGSEFEWYANYQLLTHPTILNESKKQIILQKLENEIKKIKFFKFSKTMNLANYHRSKKNYDIALSLYKDIEGIKDIDRVDWRYYYFRGICNERLGNWIESESDLLKSISLSPKQYTVINYLAYSWLERKTNILKAKKMLEEAVSLSQWEHGYIIDSLGWAYFLLEDYTKAEKLLQLAYEKTPYEFEVYDHYGDVLWKNNKKIQARYVWKKAIKLDGVEKEKIDKLNQKFLDGIN